MRLRVYIMAAFAAVLICSAASVSQVPVHINSGNPAFPFPQFLPYVHPNGDTLHNIGTLALSRDPQAKIAAAGVTHAEMEKTVRDAYQIMMLRANYATIRGISSVGGVPGAGGVRYIAFDSDPRCSEGDGYAMLAAAMMGDKVTFDGLWLNVHDFSMNKVPYRYGDGTAPPAYNYSMLPGVYNGAGDNSAADGDYDIAMALMIAHMQWGDNMGVTDVRGNQISYKNDFLKVATGLTDTLAFALARERILSGSIGLDGYFKGGDSWTELTDWSSPANLQTIGINNRVAETRGPRPQYISYAAPSYFRQFAEYMKREPNANAYAWNIFQFERAEASSEWLHWRHYQQNQRNVPFAGHVTITNDTVLTFTSVQHGEDVRTPWRTILNHVWHGNLEYTWNPVTRTVTRNTPNTYMRDVAMRYSRYLWDRREAPWSQGCNTMISGGTGETRWWGPAMLKSQISPQGEEQMIFVENWVHGTGSPAAVVSQNFNLMAEMYRQLEIEWNVDMRGAFNEQDPHTRYYGARPFYFHGFFRVLGLMVMTGNHHAPLNMKPQANMKVYLDVDKTYAFEYDTITYTVDYRNYGAEDAQGVVIVNPLNKDFVFVSGTNGAAYNPVSHAVEWNLGTVPGFKTATGIAPTQGTMQFKIFVPHANQKRYENSARISCLNGSGWVSDEYPNKISTVMKRNGFDIAKRALRVNKTVFRDTINPGMNATYTIDFENSAEAGWMNGGRPGVNFTYGHAAAPGTTAQHTFMIRLFNDAQEAYIDYGNYRVSYFLFDNNATSLNDWRINEDIAEGFSKGDTRLLHELIPAGEDSRGKWNQRLIVQTADVRDPLRTEHLATTTPHLVTYYGSPMRVHRGLFEPFRGVWRMHNATFSTRDWSGDWSYNPNTIVNTADQSVPNWGFPISPDFTESYDPEYEGKPVTSRHRKFCEAAPITNTVNNILIEEWDGYTWRRVFGNGPLPGREVVNVIIRDTLPVGVTYQRFLEPLPFGITPTISADGRVIVWQIPKLLVGEKGSIKYTVTADPLPPGVTSRRLVSRAWAIATNESPLASTAVLVVTTDSLPPPPPMPTTMWKRADKEVYSPEDTITYTITYKQTHGYPVKSGSPSEWTGTGTQRVNAAGDLITLSGPTNIHHNLTYGTNGVLTGTALPQRYEASVFIFGRADPTNANRRIELEFDAQWDGLYVTLRSNGGAPFTIANPFRANEDDSFDYKLIFKNDSLLMWIRDTSALIPSYVFTGIPVQAGNAGVRFQHSEGQGRGWVRNWASHFDMAYNVSIRDTIPPDLTFIPGSITGQLHTVPPRTLTGTLSSTPNGRQVITWPVVSGMRPQDALSANDSLTLTWKAIVDTAKNRVITNTAYADLAGWLPRDTIGAQIRSRFELEPDPPKTGLYVTATPGGGIYSRSISVGLAAFVDAFAAHDATIYYTVNGSEPDPLSLGTTIVYDGQLLLFTTQVTLKAMTILDEFEASSVITHTYEPLRTVPVISAAYFNNEVSGLAQGIKIALDLTGQQPDIDIIRNHRNLLTITGNPEYTMELHGDTLVLLFGGAGITVPEVTTWLTIRDPQLPNEDYTEAHGYLAENTLVVINPSKPHVPLTGLYVVADPVNCIFTRSVTVTLTAFVDSHIATGATIYYTTNGLTPDPDDFSTRTGTYTGQPLVLTSSTTPITLKVLVVHDDFEEAPVITHIYDPLRTVPAVSAAYFDNLGNGRAQGIRVALDMTFQQPDTAVIWRHRNLITINGISVNAEYDSIKLYNDTLVLFFRGSGIEIPTTVTGLAISEPNLPSAEYTNAHGYLAGRTLEISNNIVTYRVNIAVGPSPFPRVINGIYHNKLNIFISTPTTNRDSLQSLEALDPKIRIYDKLGNSVAESGVNMAVAADTVNAMGQRCHIFIWDGTNRRGRVVANGIYMVHVVVTEQSGRKRTEKLLVHFGGR